MKMPKLRRKRRSRLRPAVMVASAIGVGGAVAVLVTGLRRKRRAGEKHESTPAPALTPVRSDAQ